MNRRLAIALSFLAASSAPALAHGDPAGHGSLAAGLSHPFFGLDHILAMVAVGLWAALLGGRKAQGRALWLVPSAFVATMAVGFAVALAGVPLPAVEPVVLASVVVIGLAAAATLNVPAGVAMSLVGFFAFFHGHAHGGEMGSAEAISYALGFAVSTALLHVAGIGFSRAFGGRTGRLAARLAGGAAALGGLWLALGA